MDAFVGKTFKGVVNSISPASGSDFSLLPPDKATGNFTKIVQRIPAPLVVLLPMRFLPRLEAQ